MTGNRVVARIRNGAVGLLIACAPVQLFLDSSLMSLFCVTVAVGTSALTFFYVFDVVRFRNAPLSMLMVIGFNISSLSGALLIQTANLRSLIFNLTAPQETFTSIAVVQFLTITVHYIYMNSSFLLAIRHGIARKVFRPLGLLKAPTNLQLWIFGLAGCGATMLSARSYTDSIQFGDVSSKLVLGFGPFAVAPFFIPMRGALLDSETARTKASWPPIAAYALLLIAVGMANNARATFSAGFLTLGLCILIAVLSGNIVITRKTIVVGLLWAAACIPVFMTLSDLATAMVVARDERSNVSSMELIEITLANFQDKVLLEERRRLDAVIAGGDYNETYVANPIFARFVYTKFVDVNMTNALTLSPAQVKQVQSSTFSRVMAVLPTPVLNYFKLDVDKSDLGFSSGDIYSFIARGLELGGYTTGSEIPDGLTIFGMLFWPVLALFVLVQFIAYDAMSMVNSRGRLTVSAVALLNTVPVFTLGIVQESVSSQITAIVRGIPQLIFLYWIVMVASALIPTFSMFAKPVRN